jgi:hypothetical protein
MQCSETSAYKIKTPENYPEDIYTPVKMEPIQCSETLAYKIKTPENYPEDTYPPMKMEPIVFRNVGL